MTDGTTTWNYTYNADGLRTKKTDGTTTYSYVYNGSQLSQMTVGSNTLYFSYDASGVPMSVTYGNSTYYYVTNVQGDVTGILNSSGALVVSYTYDAWGNQLSCTGSMANDLGTVNPLRYRGYIFDQETGLYYLQSRYYNPEIGRFINADAFTTTGQGLLGNNMFAYCGNNPVIFRDIAGTRHEISAGVGYQNNKNKNIDNVMKFWGVDSINAVPEIPDNAMLVVENISSVTLGEITYIHGRSIVMDNDKYCEYLFNGVGYGVSGAPVDFCETLGYVYGVNDVQDYEGWFYGGSFNQLANINGGAIATNGVYSEIIYGQGFVSPSLGASATYYSTPQNDWVYGKAKIKWHAPVYREYQWDQPLM